MNKELIKKFKPEFDHWLNGGSLLAYKTKLNCWTKVDSSNHWNVLDTHQEVIIVINDKYIEFRKALAEGKTIQHNIGNVGEWIDMTNNVFIDPLTFSDGSPCYRIKPDEPKYKVGDWVTQAGSKPFQFTEDTCYLGLEPWKPQPDEWCWFEGTPQPCKCDVKCDCELLYTMPVLARFKRERSLTERTGAAYKYKYEIEDGEWFKHCEPFIGELPIFLKDT